MTNGGGDDDNANRTVFRPSPLQGLRNRLLIVGAIASRFCMYPFARSSV